MKMTKIAWVTDSSAYIPNDMKGKEDIYVVPLVLVLDGNVYKDGIDLTHDQLYAKLKAVTTPPSTSQPSIDDFITIYSKLKEQYDAVIGVFISDALSGTISTSIQAADIAGIDLKVVDSKLLSYPLTGLIERGIELNEAGKSVDEIVEQLQETANTVEAYVLVGSLQQLQRSGRLNGIQYLLGSLLNIKPIITVEEGKLVIFEKKRSDIKAVNRIFERFEQAMDQSLIKEVYVLHANAEKKAKEWKERLVSKYSDLKVLVGPLSTAVTLHAGEGTIALGWFNE